MDMEMWMAGGRALTWPVLSSVLRRCRVLSHVSSGLANNVIKP